MDKINTEIKRAKEYLNAMASAKTANGEDCANVIMHLDEIENLILLNSSLQLKEKYTQDFQDYVEKFFKYRPKVYDWVSKDGKREFTHKQLCKYYEKAMNAKPLIV